MTFKSDPNEFELISEGLSARTHGFGGLSAAYLFTNENHPELFKKIDTENKNILSVCAGSGDFMFNTLLFGAKNVDQFDISLFSKYVFEIKYQAIKQFSYNEFMDFFYSDIKFLNLKSAKKLKNNLSKQARYLLEQTMSSDVCRKWAFRLIDPDKVESTYPKVNPYTENFGNYKTLQSRLLKPGHFMPCNSELLSCHLENFQNKKYDFVYMSNILQYCTLEDFSNFTVRPLLPFLRPGSQVVSYLLDGGLEPAKKYTTQPGPISKLGFDVKKCSVQSKDFGAHDAVLIMTKTR